jgi:hypothetical protein
MLRLVFIRIEIIHAVCTGAKSMVLMCRIALLSLLEPFRA